VFWIGYHDFAAHLPQLVPGDVILKQDAPILSYDLDV